jgi:uncharacterized membrane protein YkgB
MDTLFAIAQRIAARFLRISLGIILLWIGALKFVDPTPVVGLLQASLPFLKIKYRSSISMSSSNEPEHL